MICTTEQIQDIILHNPNKSLVQKGRDMRAKLSLHLYGDGIENEITRHSYFENDEIFKVRKKYAVSNVDLFKRLLNEEEQVFTARGGSSYFNMGDNDAKMNKALSDVEYGISLRKWVQVFALEAFRSDPMSVIFMEVEPADEEKSPESYPTYKSTSNIYDYLPCGRNLEYICFQLTKNELKDFGITEPKVGNLDPQNNAPDKQKTEYYRFVDDAYDYLLKLDNGQVISLTETEAKSPKIKNNWGYVPAFVVSDIMNFSNPKVFFSSIQPIIELAHVFLFDRSIRDLQKKYHGFAKAFEPMLKCSTCAGEGFLTGSPCPDCTPPGANKGVGYKLKTQISDVAKFPIEILEQIPGFDVRSLFGYITPDIESWNKQDDSLESLESLMYYTYWNVNKIQPTATNGTNTDQTETATKSLINLQPKYARLNKTADWAEKCENMIADFIGKFLFKDSWKGSSISYGRDYILETPEDILSVYFDMRTKGVPDAVLDEQIEKYIRAIYQNNPLQMNKYLKLIQVDPWPHQTAQQIEASAVVPLEDKISKRYYGEWVNTLKDGDVIGKTVQQLRELLKVYIADKQKAVQQETAAAQSNPSNTKTI